LSTRFRWTLLHALVSALALAADPPYGHRDFYPSPERPIGFRADGTGNYPGATPVTEWWEGAVAEDPSRVIRTPDCGSVHGRKWADRNARNVVWKMKLPGWSDTQPVVVGDRIVGIADPDWVFCLDAHTGKTLWQDRLMPMFLPPPPTNGVPSRCPYTPEDAWKRQQVADIARALFYLGGAGGAASADNERLEKAVKATYDARDVAVRLDAHPAIAQAFDEFIARLEELQSASLQGRPEAAKRIGFGLVAGRLIDLYRVMVLQCWMGDVGLTQSSPVTDGECVYVALGHGPIACYDLTGRRRWAWREVDYQLRALYCDHTPSLVLADGVLLVRSHFGDIMGLDPKTGNILHNTDIGPSYNHGAFATPGVIRLTSPGGKKLTVLVTQHDKVIGVRDGKILAEMPFLKNGDVGHGQPRLVWNDLVVYQSSQAVPPDGGPGIVVRLKLADDGTVTAEKLHHFGGARFGNVPMALTSDGRMLGGAQSLAKKGPRPLEALGGGSLWNLADGAPLAGTDGPGRSEGGGVVIAGSLRLPLHPRPLGTGRLEPGRVRGLRTDPAGRLQAHRGPPRALGGRTARRRGH
jgi:outer membrane protein assembly factor BamB